MPPEIRRIDPSELQGWLDTNTTVFLGRPDIEALAPQLREFWDFGRVWGAFDGGVVGTLRSWATELTVPGGALVPAAAISGVSVLPTHRRRGLLRSMMAAEQAAARERGEILGLLYSAETAIYGRFGYGAAVTTCTWTLDKRSSARLGPPAAGVSLAPIDETTRLLVRDLFERYRRTQPGEIRRREITFGLDLGLVALASEKPWKGWVAVHRDPSGEADGFVRYTGTEKWEDRQPRYTVEIEDLVALDATAGDALWRFVLDLDLVTTVKAELRTLVERVPWLLANRRAAMVSGVGDGLWVSLLDIPAALGARTYERSADLVLEVIEGEPENGRVRVRLEAGPEGARCRRTTASPDLTLHADALGAAYLGGTPLRHAVLTAGADEHRAGVLAEAEAVFRTLVEPRCSTFF